MQVVVSKPDLLKALYEALERVKQRVKDQFEFELQFGCDDPEGEGWVANRLPWIYLAEVKRERFWWSLWLFSRELRREHLTIGHPTFVKKDDKGKPCVRYHVYTSSIEDTVDAELATWANQCDVELTKEIPRA